MPWCWQSAGLWAGPYFSSVYGLEPVARGNALLVMAAAMSAGAMAYGPLDRLLGTRKWVVFGGVTRDGAVLRRPRAARPVALPPPSSSWASSAASA